VSGIAKARCAPGGDPSIVAVVREIRVATECHFQAHGARLDKKGDAAKAAKKNKKQDASKIATRR